ncbi:hypothetical protein M404DRAFT_160038, partial [Pisolithus tinctorius Marx 270]
VCQVLMLVANSHTTFKTSNLGNIWTTVILKRNQYEFNNAIWVTATRHYLQPIKCLSDENFTLIIEDTQKYIKKSMVVGTATGLDEEDSDYKDLFTFH